MKPTWLNDAIYRDITLADAKAVFSMSLATLGVAGAASFFGSMPDAQRRALALANPGVLLFMGFGVLSSLLAIVCAVITVLPRRYVTKENDPHGSSFLGDMRGTVGGVFRKADGGSSLLDSLYRDIQNPKEATKTEDGWPTPKNLIAEIGRLVEVRRRKYRWVGPSIIFSALGVLLMIIGVLIAVLAINRASGREEAMTVRKIVSGGQTGADRAALDFAMEAGFDYGGFVPSGRTDEFGTLPPQYRGMREAPGNDPAVRTALNVCSSDGTVVFARGTLTKGSLLTAELATALERPLLHIDPSSGTATEAAATLNRWIARHRVTILNVAGPRHSEDDRIYDNTMAVLRRAFPNKSR